MKPKLKLPSRPEPPVAVVIPDVYALLADYADAARAEAARGGQARTDTEHATAAAKGNADA